MVIEKLPEFAPALVHPFLAAVTVIVPAMFAPVVFKGAVHADKLPVPLATKPIPVLLLDQTKVSLPPVLAPKVMAGMASPEQTLTLGITLTTGSALIVIVNALALSPALVQPFFEAVTVIVPTMSVPEKLTGAV